MIDMETLTVNGLPALPGCYIDGHYGQYSLARLVEITDDILGTHFSLDFPKDEYGRLAGAIGPGGVWDIGSEHTERCVEVADRAEAALSVATKGGYWTWEDGEFFLVSDLDDDEDSW